eukprot:Skav224568  [mRNA]  locus=scaffold4295:192200:193015:- [translate_table: standard]
MESECFLQIRRSFGMQILVFKPETDEALTNLGLKLVEAFLQPKSAPVSDSIRVVSDLGTRATSWDANLDSAFYSCFLQLRVGGAQAPAAPMGDLFMNGLDPVGGGAIRRAWWAGVRSVIDGLPIPPDARVLLIGDRYLGDSAGCLVMALISTGNDYGVLKCYLRDSMDCCMVCGGGIKEKLVKQELGSLIKCKSRNMVNIFEEFLLAFEVSINGMMNSASWSDEWTYPPTSIMEDDRSDIDFDDFYEEDMLESYFHVLDQPDDVGPWCFGT